MRTQEARRRIAQAIEGVNKEIDAFARQGRMAAGVANEGFDGGYVQALRDVLLLLGDVEPNGRKARHWEGSRRRL